MWKQVPQRVLQLVFVLNAATLVVNVALRSRSLLSPLAEVTHPHLNWLTITIITKTVSLATYALIVRNLLNFGNVPTRIRSLLRTTLDRITMNASLPNNQVASTTYWYKQLRHKKTNDKLATLTIV